MKGKLKTLIAVSFAALFGTATATAQTCPPMPDCELEYWTCLESGGNETFCRQIIERCIADMCSGGPGPGIPPA